LLDYNRAGIPLIEIVTKPIEGAGERAPEVAKAYVAELREVIKALAVSEARMDKGQMRCDVNLSLRPHGREEFGTRSETKNVNSLRSVERAARFEIQRHAAVLNSGGTIVQETRHFHEEDGSTTSGRIKDNAEDYRYFPEPDLVPVAPARTWVEELRAGLPEMPRVRRNRLREEWGVSEHDMQSILNAGAVDPIVATIEAGADSAAARKWWMGEMARNANETGKALDELPVTPVQVARVAELVAKGDLNDKLARQVFEGVLAGEGTPDEVVEKRGLKVVSDEGALSTAVEEAIDGNPAIADKIRSGKVAAAGALVGAVMKATRGQADAARVKELILEKLGVEG
ncbi:Asp-tRNA(Asn)/Glu-tRNA(Gln) amidotransferase subunit GatB, partial [Streptomyces sp. NPDC059900]